MRSTKRGVRASVDTKAALCYCIFFIVICGEGQLNNGSFCSVLFNKAVTRQMSSKSSKKAFANRLTDRPTVLVAYRVTE